MTWAFVAKYKALIKNIPQKYLSLELLQETLHFILPCASFQVSFQYLLTSVWIFFALNKSLFPSPTPFYKFHWLKVLLAVCSLIITSVVRVWFILFFYAGTGYSVHHSCEWFIFATSGYRFSTTQYFLYGFICLHSIFMGGLAPQWFCSLFSSLVAFLCLYCLLCHFTAFG